MDRAVAVDVGQLVTVAKVGESPLAPLPRNLVRAGDSPWLLRSCRVKVPAPLR